MKNCVVLQRMREPIERLNNVLFCQAYQSRKGMNFMPFTISNYISPYRLDNNLASCN